jgi:hypothetical protein
VRGAVDSSHVLRHPFIHALDTRERKTVCIDLAAVRDRVAGTTATDPAGPSLLWPPFGAALFARYHRQWHARSEAALRSR